MAGEFGHSFANELDRRGKLAKLLPASRRKLETTTDGTRTNRMVLNGPESRTSLTSKDGWMVQRECAAKQRLQAVGLHPASSESMLREFTALEAGIFLDTTLKNLDS